MKHHLKLQHIILVDTKRRELVWMEKRARTPPLIKTVITRKLIAPFLDLWQRTCDSPLRKPHWKQPRLNLVPSFHTLSLSISYTHANHHLICILMISLFLFSRLSELRIKFSVTCWCPSRCAGVTSPLDVLLQRPPPTPRNKAGWTRAPPAPAEVNKWTSVLCIRYSCCVVDVKDIGQAPAIAHHTSSLRWIHYRLRASSHDWKGHSRPSQAPQCPAQPRS